MKKFVCLALAVLLTVSVFGLSAFAEEKVTATVTVAVKGELVAPAVSVSVADIDQDGALTVNDALYAVHVAACPKGADGYGYYTHPEYGLSLGKLWNDESGNFGYYVNNASAWSLADPVKDGDSVYAFVYADGEGFSDTYSFFDVSEIAAKAGEEVTVTLTGAGFDANWNPVNAPVAGAVITVDGTRTENKTDDKGVATLTFDKNGTFVVSAVSTTAVLVPPVCVITVTGAEPEQSEPEKEDPKPEEKPEAEPETETVSDTNPKTGDASAVSGAALVLALSVVAFAVVKKKSYEA